MDNRERVVGLDWKGSERIVPLALAPGRLIQFMPIDIDDHPSCKICIRLMIAAGVSTPQSVTVRLAEATRYDD